MSAARAKATADALIARVRRPSETEQALPVALRWFAGLTPGKWRMVRARLDDLPEQPEAVAEVLADLRRATPGTWGEA